VVRLDIPGDSCRVYRNESQELLCCSHLSHLVCRRRHWFGTHGPGAAYWDLGAKPLYRAGDSSGLSAHAVLCSLIVPAKFSALSKCAWLAAAGVRTSAER